MWGFLREDAKTAQKAGLDNYWGIPRTSLLDYLNVIFPEVKDWVHDKTTGRKELGLIRPDYRSEQLALVVEFNGLPHYQKPDIIVNDYIKKIRYEAAGYKYVAVPYFIQFSNEVVWMLFQRKVSQDLFDIKYTSLTPGSCANPAYLCPMGLERMAQEFKDISPEQYQLCIQELRKGEDWQTGADLLEEAYNKLY